MTLFKMYQLVPPDNSQRTLEALSCHFELLPRPWTTSLGHSREGIGYLVGKGSRHIKQEVSQTLELSEVIHPLQGNESFIGRPNRERNRAWENLFPEDGGFFIHPSIAPERSVFSTFHQVHCLEQIWRSWWSLYDQESRPPTEPDHRQKRRSHLHAPDENGQHHHQVPETVHFNHCVELLRNVLMCQPDLTVEVANPQTGGVTGFDSEHKCQNWDDLLRWTREWQTQS
ncbi:uncharacterized protein BDZ83DRAFT_785360 [Colletotrichum acutatum]|uniref:Uncharacterized protein n=1 Tax=Glomerella acutata TaxID=27357 RepID=A0AAD8UHY3_GLOAC|nr:uncharacterized protein BDZ83DRAFT_785360 [Colletotrichum acutatum]KAK1720340.1 hypothetical protein BDZ83DRAFT_785360 [Colletotrichum acutatum]